MRKKNSFFVFLKKNYIHYITKNDVFTDHRGSAEQPGPDPNGIDQSLPRLDPSDRTE